MAASSSLEGSVCIARCMEGMYIKISIAVDVGFKKKKKKTRDPKLQNHNSHCIRDYKFYVINL